MVENRHNFAPGKEKSSESIEKQTMKRRTTHAVSGVTRLSLALMILLLTLFFLQQPVQAASLADSSAAAMKLVAFGADSRRGFDEQAAATLVEYVIGAKPSREGTLPAYQKATGAYYEYDTRISFANFLKYSYSNQIPSTLTSPASLRYSLWSDLSGRSEKLPGNWEMAPSDGKPVIVRGVERIGITPDINTGVYYKYDLKKTLILFNHENRQVLISISKQAKISDVGKKGLILGNDDDWNYYYSGEVGSNMAGLGWVKSYIYDYFSVGVHVQSGASVRSGHFQWIRAGWSGMNFAEPKHVLKGMKRNARNSKEILESPKLPSPNQVVSAYQRLASLSQNALAEKYAALQQARQRLAASGRIAVKTQESSTSREQIVQELMLEYFKRILGKPALLANL